MKNSTFRKGATYGLMVGIIVSLTSYLVASVCLPYHISETAAPFYCSSSVTTTLATLTFPVSLLTNDLSAAPAYGLLSLGLYALVGGLLTFVL